VPRLVGGGQRRRAVAEEVSQLVLVMVLLLPGRGHGAAQHRSRHKTCAHAPARRWLAKCTEFGPCGCRVGVDLLRMGGCLGAGSKSPNATFPRGVVLGGAGGDSLCPHIRTDLAIVDYRLQHLL